MILSAYQSAANCSVIVLVQPSVDMFNITALHPSVGVHAQHHAEQCTHNTETADTIPYHNTSSHWCSTLPHAVYTLHNSVILLVFVMYCDQVLLAVLSNANCSLTFSCVLQLTVGTMRLGFK
jgi:hypothetical protein